MKKIKFCGAFLCLVLFSTSIFAQKSTLPKKVSETFERKFPEVEDVAWEVKSKGDYKIKFELEGKKTVVEIDEDGTWEKTSTHISFDELPQVVQTTVNEQKKNSEITEIKIVINDDDEIYYRIDLTDENKTIKLEISKKGKIIKSETEK
ncbi:MAG: PepSY-like domain-containing protein [Bacteroidales bacterium]|nr:PepSY-like domain-containing protein [Bacteroidales bacterium]